MSSPKEKDSNLKKTEGKPQEGEVKTQKRSNDPARPAEQAQASSGFKPSWLIGGSVVILILALLYTRQAEESALKKDHPVRETEQINGDEKGFAYLQESWKGVFNLEKEGHSLSISSLRCSEVDGQTIDDTLPRLVKEIGEHTNVKNLTLAYPICKPISNKGFIQFSTNLGQYLPKLTNLRVDIKGYPNITDEGLNHFTSTIAKHLNHLEQLSLQLVYLANLTDDSLNHFATALDKFPKSLQDFSLDFIGSTRITNDAFKNLVHSVGRNLPDLKNFRLSIRFCDNITKEVVNDITSSIGEKNKNLETLYLMFGIKSITDNEVQLLTQNLAGLKRLTGLSVGFMQSMVSGAGLAQLSKSIAENYPALENLLLDLTSANIQDEGMKALGKNLQHKLTNLKALTLNFNGCGKIEDEGIKSLASALENRKVLEKLTIWLQTVNKVTDVGVIELAKNIGQYLTNLQSLYLIIPQNSKITDESVKQIGAIFTPKLHSLRELNIQFRGSDSFTTEAAKILAEPIGENLINLEKLTIDFGRFGGMNDEAVQHIATAISKRLHKLQELEFHTSKHSLSDQGLKILAEALSQFRQDLKVLSLAFEDSKKTFTDEGTILLASAIGKHLRSLRKLVLNFNASPFVSDKTVKNLHPVLLKDLPNLNDFFLKFYQCGQVTNAELFKLAEIASKQAPNINQVNFVYPQRVTDNDKLYWRPIVAVIPFLPL